MLERIDSKEIMTVWEASKKYRTKYMCYIRTEDKEPGSGGDDDLCYVIYIADSERELSTLPRESYWGKPAGFMPGHAAEPLQVGGYQIQ